MLKREAQWLGSQIASLDDDHLFPLLNVGSSTRAVREIHQPWIDEYIFAPMRRRGGTVVHLDLKADEGVDIVGDLYDPVCWTTVKNRGFRSVFCSNVLEHVTDREGLCRKLVELIPAGGYLIVSVPRAFPYHPDPIDTMFRPDVQELVALFPGTRCLAGQVVDCGTVFGLLDRNVIRLAKKTLGMLLSRARPSRTTSGEGLVQWLYPWSFRPFQATCVVLQKLP